VTQPSGTPITALRVLLAVSVAVTASLWLSLLFLLQLEGRNRLAGSPGESSPLYLAVLGLPSVLLATACTVAARVALRRERRGRDATRPLALCLTLLVVGAVVVLGMPPYGAAVWEFALLPWRVLANQS
jgi:membrane protease YdiL (CAAX protease family)